MEKCQHTDGFFVGANEYDESLLRRWSTKSLRCLLCHGPVKYRHGPKIKPHFAHVARAVCEYREPETHEHVCGKEVIKQWVSSLFPANNTTVEACVSNGNQRADVLTVFPDGQQLCIEFQCSPVPLEVLRKRMKGYEENGIAQLWIIGYSRFRGKPLNRFRLQAWEDVIRQRHKQMLCVLDTTDQTMYVFEAVTPLKGYKTLFTSEKTFMKNLQEVSVAPDGTISVKQPYDTARPMPKHKPQKKSPNIQPSQMGSTNQVEKQTFAQLQTIREKDFFTNPLRAFAISVLGDEKHLNHPFFNQQIAGDDVFWIDHRLWQSYLFLTEVHKVYQRRAKYATGLHTPVLFIKHLLVHDDRFPERPFQTVVQRYGNFRLLQARRSGDRGYARVKTVHELVYEYFCRLEQLGLLRNVTPRRESLTAAGQLFGKFEVLFDRFCPRLHGETEDEIKAFFRQHRLRYCNGRWLEGSGKTLKPLHI